MYKNFNNYPIIKVSVQMLRPEEGGRSGCYALLQASDYFGQYRPHIRFEGTQKMWGVGFEVLEDASYEKQTMMVGQFMFEKPPNESLTIDRQFDMLEGSRVVGHGTIIDIVFPDV